VVHDSFNPLGKRQAFLMRLEGPSVFAVKKVDGSAGVAPIFAVYRVRRSLPIFDIPNILTGIGVFNINFHLSSPRSAIYTGNFDLHGPTLHWIDGTLRANAAQMRLGKGPAGTSLRRVRNLDPIVLLGPTKHLGISQPTPTARQGVNGRRIRHPQLAFPTTSVGTDRSRRNQPFPAGSSRAQQAQAGHQAVTDLTQKIETLQAELIGMEATRRFKTGHWHKLDSR